MTPNEIAVLRAYLERPDPIVFEHNGERYTLDQWIEKRGDEAIARLLSDPEVGKALGRTIERDVVSADELKAEIASSAEFATMPASVMEKLSWCIGSGAFRMDNEKLRTGVENLLQPFAEASTKFAALRTRPASIAETLVGRTLSTNEISEVLG